MQAVRATKNGEGEETKVGKYRPGDSQRPILTIIWPQRYQPQWGMGNKGVYIAYDNLPCVLGKLRSAGIADNEWGIKWLDAE